MRDEPELTLDLTMLEFDPNLEEWMALQMLVAEGLLTQHRADLLEQAIRLDQVPDWMLDDLLLLILVRALPLTRTLQ